MNRSAFLVNGLCGRVPQFVLLVVILLCPVPLFADTASSAARAAYDRGLEHFRAKRVEEAIREYSEAIRLDANYMEAYNNRGFAWYSLGRYEPAIKDYDAAIRVRPHAYAYGNRGSAHRMLGQYQQALNDYREALRMDPTLISAYNNQAWLMATAKDAQFRDGKKGIELALRACELSKWENARHIDTLAAAYAEAGDFTAAIRSQEKALALPGLQKPDEARARLELYRQGMPFRE